MTAQIIVIHDEYNVDSYKHEIDVPVLYFNLALYEDQYPDKGELIELREEIDKVEHPAARKYLEQWYKENYRDWDKEEEEARERLAARRAAEEAENIAFLESKGYTVTK